MIGLKIIDRAGTAHELHAAQDTPLMETLRDQGLVDGACGGNCACATCHVYVEADWYAKLPPADSFESDLLKAGGHYRPGSSRLACQIHANAALDGIPLVIAPEE